MPAKQRIGLEDEDSIPPTLDPAREKDELEAIGWGEARLVRQTMEEKELHAEEGLLGYELAVDVFRGDGWQLVISDPEKAVRIALFVRAYLVS